MRYLTEENLTDMAGCTRFCVVSMQERDIAWQLLVTHNGVSFSHRVCIDAYLLAVAEQGVAQTMIAWMKAHHAGKHADPFEFEIEPGKTVLVPEWTDA